MFYRKFSKYFEILASFNIYDIIALYFGIKIMDIGTYKYHYFRRVGTKKHRFFFRVGTYYSS